MHSEGFRLWRRALGLSQKDAAEALGLKRRMVQYYEKGERDGDTVDIPLSVRLACFALTRGVVDYAGPPTGPKRNDKLRRHGKKLRDREKGKTKAPLPGEGEPPEDDPAPPDDTADAAVAGRAPGGAVAQVAPGGDGDGLAPVGTGDGLAPVGTDDGLAPDGTGDGATDPPRNGATTPLTLGETAPNQGPKSAP